MRRLAKRAAAAVRALWAREPVLVGSVLPIAVSVGILSSEQASALTAALTSAAAAVVQLGAAWKVRSVVTSPATKLRERLQTAAGVRLSLGQVADAIGTLTRSGASANAASQELTSTIGVLRTAAAGVQKSGGQVVLPGQAMPTTQTEVPPPPPK